MRYLWSLGDSQRGGRPIKWLQAHPIWKKYAGRFPVTLVKTADLDRKEKYILGYHPHGAACIGAFYNFATEGTGFSDKFPGIRPYLTNHRQTHYMPMYREFLHSFGIGDSSKENIRHILQQKGHMVVIVVGGVREALMTDPEEHYLVLKERKGFVKMAIQMG